MSAILDAAAAPFDRLTPERNRNPCTRRWTSSISGPTRRSSPRARRPKASISSSRAASRSAEQDELVGLLGPKDFFDSRALVQGVGVSAFIAREETLCSLAPRQRTLLRLINANPRFGAFFYHDISSKLDALAQKGRIVADRIR